MKTQRNKKTTVSPKPADVSAALFCLVAAAALLIFADGAAQGIREGMSICVDTVLPSLLPFLILSSFLGQLHIPFRRNGLVDRVCRLLFHLRAEHAVRILLSFVSGYPVGLRSCAAAYSEGRIDDDEAAILSAFCLNAGPAFLITAVGRNMFHSASVGLILFISVSLSSVLTGVLASLPRRGHCEKKTGRTIGAADRNESGDMAERLIRAVNDAGRAVLGVSLWIIAFGAVRGVLSAAFGDFPEWLTVFAEVTDGCEVCATNGAPALAAAVCAFGGLCVHCQVLPCLKTIKIKYRHFFKYRMIHSFLSYGLCRLLLGLSRVGVETLAAQDATPHRSFGALQIALLLLLCLSLIADTAPKNTRPQTKRTEQGVRL